MIELAGGSGSVKRDVLRSRATAVLAQDQLPVAAADGENVQETVVDDGLPRNLPRFLVKQGPQEALLSCSVRSEGKSQPGSCHNPARSPHDPGKPVEHKAKS